MKKSLVQFLNMIARNNFLWKLFKPIATVGFILHNSRKTFEKSAKLSNKKSMVSFKSLEVKNGPFKGMKYPSLSSFGSTLFPKLLGSYETNPMTIEVSLTKIIQK
ncbi:MAG: hypothetical protein QM734_08190 [Cyclobacteriaceae bacterium]